MYTGNNPTALRSMEWLLKAFNELLETNDYASITIKEVCQKADLSRQTFYQLFNSKEELVTYQCEDFFAGYMDELLKKNTAPDDLDKIVFLFFDYARKYKKLIRLLVDNNFSYVITEKWYSFLQEINELKFQELSSYQNQYLYWFISGAVSQILLQWFQNDMDLSTKEISKLTLELIKGKYFQLS